MSGVAVAVSLYKANTAITNIVPATRIFAGDVAPLGTVKPYIIVMSIDGIPYSLLHSETVKQRNERVQTTIMCGALTAAVGTGYPGVKLLLRLLWPALVNQRGTIAGFAVDGITEAGDGPDLSDISIPLYSQSTDVFVRYSS